VRLAAAVPALGLLAGSAAGLSFPDIAPVLLYSSLALAAVVVGCALGLRRDRAFVLGVFLAFASGGSLLASDAWRQAWRSPLRLAFESVARDQRALATRQGRSVPEDPSAEMLIVGRLAADAAPAAGGGISLRIETRRAGRVGRGRGPADMPPNQVRGGLLLTVLGPLAAERAGELRAGRRVRASALVRRPARYLDPGVADQERALARRGISLVGTVKSGALVDVLERGSPPSELAAAVRAYARRAIRAAVGRWSDRSAGIVTAIVIGDRSGLDASVETRLQEAGTYHVIAISGGNVAILAGVVLTIFRLAGLLGPAAMLCSAAGLLGYGYLVAGSASVDRATVMAIVYLLGRAIDLGGPPLHVLVLAAGVLAAADPLVVSDPGFLLTFGATASILLAASSVSLQELPPRLKPVAAMLLASAAAEAALLPIAAAFFSRITLAGLLLNFAAIPLMAVAQLAGMLVVPVYAMTEAGSSGLGWIAHLGAEGLVRSADLVRLAPMLTWRVAAPGPAATAIYYVAGAAAWMLWRRHRDLTAERPAERRLRHGSTALAIATGLFIAWPPWAIRTRGGGHLRVTFIDVGQGDASIVQFPGGASMQIDAGGLTGSTFDIGDRVVAPVLRQKGVHRLGTLVLTHGDADHIGGALASIREFRPWDVWEGIPVPPFAPLQRVAEAAGEAGSRSVNVQAGDQLTVDGVSILIRHPGRPDWERQHVRNDDSIVMELRWGDVSIVLTGDIGREVERGLSGRFAPAPLRVLKVPHHGSATSSSAQFIEALAPAVAVISVGRSNNYGHPAPVVLDRYALAHAAIFRTDRDGAVTVETDGTLLEVESYTGRRVCLEAGASRRLTPSSRAPTPIRARRDRGPGCADPTPQSRAPSS
jgi:competence protein ComEC